MKIKEKGKNRTPIHVMPIINRCKGRKSKKMRKREHCMDRGRSGREREGMKGMK